MIVQTDDLQVLIRRPRPTDQGFIASTWVDSMTSRRAGERSQANHMVDRLLDDPAVRILIAAEPTRTDVILGWIAYTPLPASRVIHYAYVRDRMRHRGIARKLLEEAFGQAMGVCRIMLTMTGPDTESLACKYPSAIMMMDLEEFLGP